LIDGPPGFDPGLLPVRSRWHPALPAGVALAVGVVVSLLVFQTLRNAEHRHLVVQFNQLAAERTGAVRRNFGDVVDAVLALRTFLGVSGETDRAAFAVYAAPLLSERPGIRALEWVPRVSRHRRGILERRARGDGLGGFTFTERDASGKLVPRRPRDDYYPVFYSVPARGNEVAMGFDLASDAVRRNALERARDTGRPAATPPIPLLQDDGALGCLVVTPVYDRPLSVASVAGRREALRGFVVGVLTSGEMLETALGAFSPEGVEIRISDVTAPGAAIFLGAWKPGIGSVRHESQPPDPEPARGFVRQSRFELADRAWKVTTVATPGFFDEAGSPIAWVVLAGLLGFSALLSFYLYRTSERAERLRESEARYRILVEHAPEAIVILDVDSGRFVDANENALHLLGITRLDMGRYGPADLSPEFQPGGRPSAEVAAQRIGEALAGGAPAFEWIHRSLDGREIPCEVRLVRLPAGKRNLVRGSMTDISERRRAQEEREALERRLAEARKLESLGLLTGGIAHDFNNLLTPILGRADLALEEMAEGTPGRSHLQDIRISAARAGELIGQLLAFTGQARVTLTSVRLNEVVREMSRLCSVSMPLTDLQVDLDPADPRVRGDGGQMRQLVLNLITNAGDAVGEGGGTVCIATERVEAGPELLASCLVAAEPAPEPGSYVRLSVSDTGPGIDPAILGRIFDPFFSTKTQGRGLGLATLQGIVKSHRGGVVVRSEPGRGTTFEVLFPADPAGTSPVPPGARTEARAPRREGKGTVLVADDEVRVRSLVAAVLSREGYRTFEARNGSEVLAMLLDGVRSADLALLDLNMPGLSGVEMLTRLRRAHPDLPVVVMTGFGEKAALAACADLGLRGFLAKPFDPGQLLETVQQAFLPI